MNAMLESAMAWLLWTGVWWAVLALGLAVWFRVKPPQTAAVRHMALSAAIVAGTLAGVIPRWGNGVVTHDVSVVMALSDVAPEPMEPEVVQSVLPAALPAPAHAAGGTDLAPEINARTYTVIPVRPLRDWLTLGMQMIAAAWVLGALLLSARLIRAVRMTLRWRREAVPLAEGEQAVFAALRQELRVRRATNAGSHMEPTSPIVLCGWPPLVLVPSDWPTWEPASRYAAWRHELAHVRRRDDWWRMLSEGLRVLWWFHPGVRWLLSRREHEAELLSDEAAVAAGCPPQELAQVLLDACRRPQSAVWTAPAGTFFSSRTMKVRIARLLEAPSAEALCRPAPRGLRLAAFAGIALLALAGSMRWTRAANSANAVAPVDLSKLERKIIKEPQYQSKHPMYCLLALGKNAERHWLVLDIVTEPNTNGPGENVAYFDRDGDGDLTRPGNRIVGTIVKAGTEFVSFSPEPRVRYNPHFELGDVVLADGTRHENISLDMDGLIQDYRPIEIRTHRDGGPRQLVATPPFGSLLRCGDNLAEAPIVHLDGPLALRVVTSDGKLQIPTVLHEEGRPERKTWLAEYPPKFGKRKLVPGQVFDLEAEVGTPGYGRGTFAKIFCGLPPEQAHPVGEIVLPDGRRLPATLDQRCCMTIFRTKVLIPADAPQGLAKLVLRYPAWAAGQVAEAIDEVEVISADAAPKIPRLQPERKARIGELLGVQIDKYPVVPRGGSPTTVEKDGTLRLPKLPPLAVAGKTAEEIEGLIQEALGMLHEPRMHVAVCFLRSAADVPDPPAKAAVPMKERPNYVKVVGQLLDADTGKPIEKAAWEWGMASLAKPEEVAWGHSRSGGGSYPDGKFEQLVNFTPDGRFDRLRVYSAGYETTVVVDDLPNPRPLQVERIVRMKRGQNISGVLRDHTGKPVANGWVFFIPKGHRSNIVEGFPGTDAYELPSASHDDAVAEVRTNIDGTFAMSVGTAGTLAASIDAVDLWPFPLPDDGHAELKMPAPSYLVIDLTYWYLDKLAKKGKLGLSANSEDPNQCWIQVDRSGAAEPLWKNLDYRRQMLVFAHDPRAKLSKGVTVGQVIEGECEKPIPGVGHNKNLATKIRVALPPGSYRVQRLRTGPFAPVDEQNVVLQPGGETVLSWARGDGSAVRGKATWPANMAFVRQPGEQPRKLDWTVPDSAAVWIAPAAGGKAIEAAKIQADGSFFIATHLEPGKYMATATVYMPETDFRGGLRLRDCVSSQEFTVPDPVRGPNGSPPVSVEIAMDVGKGGRFVPVEAP